MASLSERGLELRGGVARALLGAETILFEEMSDLRLAGEQIELVLIDGSSRRIRLGRAAPAVARQLERVLHPARALLPTIRSLQGLRDALAEAGAMLPSALLELLVLGAARLGATDLHLEAERELALRVRIDGMIHELVRLEPERARRLLGRLKVVSGLISYREDVTQEGRARIELDGVAVAVRVTTSAGIFGERAALRLHDERKATLELEELGFDAAVLGVLRAAARLRRGLVIVAGPPSSGKSTTLFALLRRLRQIHGGSRRLISIEDPVEVELPGVAQSQVDAARGDTHARLLASALRQDAEVILVGELRDRETAALAAQAALSGHLVLTSLHAGTVAESFLRLRDLELEPATLAATLRALVAQRLVRRRCGECGGAGCPGCHLTGYRGRVAVGEAVLIEGASPILERPGAAEIEAACVAAAMVPLRRAASEQVADGVTTREEIERVLG